MIVNLAKSVINDGYNVPEDFLIADIRTRVQRSMENPPIYDIDNDKTLIKAMEILKNETVNSSN